MLREVVTTNLRSEAGKIRSGRHFLDTLRFLGRSKALSILTDAQPYDHSRAPLSSLFEALNLELGKPEVMDITKARSPEGSFEPFGQLVRGLSGRIGVSKGFLP
jgi:hypothetical protein